VDKSIPNVFDLCKKMLSNKTSQGIGITRMEEALISREYGMEVTCHKDLISCGK
jgi:hypothetical protein